MSGGLDIATKRHTQGPGRNDGGKLMRAAFLVLVMCVFSVAAQGKYGGGTGEPNDPYLIFDSNQMNAIGADSNDWDKHFKLMADIDLSGFTGDEFNIIGTDYYNPFSGVFDGNSHTISNFTYDSTWTDCIGLFGYVVGEIKDLGLINPDVDAGISIGVGSLVGLLSYGAITNCYVEGSSVSGEYFVGGLVGASDGTITNCYSTASVTGYRYVGGLVGYSYGTITNCYSTGNVLADEYVGGLVGLNVGTVSNCFSAGSVAGTTLVGGLVGLNGLNSSPIYDPGTILNCYSTSSVEGDFGVGGLMGGNSWGTITNSYSTGSVLGSQSVGGLVGWKDLSEVVNSFWDIQTSGQTTSAAGKGKTTEEMQMASTFIAWGCYPVWTIDEGKDYPRFWWENYPGEPITKPSYGGGSGEPDDPYLIYTAEQLNMIGLIPCDWRKHFKLMADIDLAGFTGTSFNIIGYYVSWNSPDNKPFTGVFDGNDHTISNFTYNSKGINDTGLFGYVGTWRVNAVIKDLGLIEPDLNAGTGWYVGSLVGRLYGGTISGCYVQGGSVSGRGSIGGLLGENGGTIINCYATSIVSGNRYVGGLVGLNNQSGAITNCYSAGSVSGDWHIGGLLGKNYRGTITNCYSSGSVSGTGWCVSGLVGYNWAGTITNCYANGSATGNSGVGELVGGNNGTISDCYSAGDVSGDYFVGGLAGYNSYGTITNCYSISDVNGVEDVGGLVGWNNNGEIAASFWDIETSRQETSDGGTGKTTAEMQTESTFAAVDWDFTTPVWTIYEAFDYPRLWWETPVLQVEPEVTLGTNNRISWDPVFCASQYYAECAEDANFNSIVYASGWITETSYEFTGLQVGRRYWYSVKAKNAVDIETNWSNVESSLQGTLADAVEIMLAPSSLKSEKLKNSLLNKINTVLEMIDDGLHEDALNKLEHDILAKMNGCGETGEPDKNDWIITCEAQNEIYPLVIETIEYVRGLMGE